LAKLTSLVLYFKIFKMDVDTFQLLFLQECLMLEEEVRNGAKLDYKARLENNKDSLSHDGFIKFSGVDKFEEKDGFVTEKAYVDFWWNFALENAEKMKSGLLEGKTPSDELIQEGITYFKETYVLQK
jgi:hypothetical protein